MSCFSITITPFPFVSDVMSHFPSAQLQRLNHAFVNNILERYHQIITFSSVSEQQALVDFLGWLPHFWLGGAVSLKRSHSCVWAEVFSQGSLSIPFMQGGTLLTYVETLKSSIIMQMVQMVAGWVAFSLIFSLSRALVVKTHANWRTLKVDVGSGALDPM